MTELTGLKKRVNESQAERVEVVLPNDANPLGYVLGGHVMQLIDITAAVAAQRHSQSLVVTASMDELAFLHPIPVGHFIILKASVNYVAKTSMEVGVKVFSENPLTGERVHTSSAYLTFVAIDGDGNPHAVPRLIAETETEKRRYREAVKRRVQRLARKQSKPLNTPV